MDLGGAFAMGAVAGSIWHGIRGLRNSPANERLMGALMSARVKGPVMGGQFAVWGGTFSTCDCMLSALRGQEDAYNAIGSGALTGAVLAARNGARAAASSALVGGAILASFEGIGFIMSQAMQARQEQEEGGESASFFPSISWPISLGGSSDSDDDYRPETGRSI
jgi:mitochondrial import inner membrane translocase subunit TIM17